MAHRIAIVTTNRLLTSNVVAKSLTSLPTGIATYTSTYSTDNNNRSFSSVFQSSITRIQPKHCSTYPLSSPSFSSSFHSTCVVEEEATTSEATVTEASPQVEEIFQEVCQLDFVELHLLGELVYDKMGMTMSASMRAGGGGSAGAAPKEEEQEVVEKTAFDLKLTGFDAKSKIKVIKEVRTITGLGLKDAKAMVEGAPIAVKKDIKMEEAEELKAKLEAIGATVEIE